MKTRISELEEIIANLRNALEIEQNKKKGARTINISQENINKIIDNLTDEDFIKLAKITNPQKRSLLKSLLGTNK